MSYFADAEDLYGTLGQLITDALDDELLGPLFARANTITRFAFLDPKAMITMRLADGEPSVVEFGMGTLEPDVTLTMEADDAHRFWLGELNLGVALARGQIVAEGPVDKLLRLMPLAARVFPRYRRLLAVRGRPEEGTSALDATAV